MTTRALSIAVFLGLCLSLSAQTYGPAQLPFAGGPLDRAFPRLPSLSLTDQERVSFMALSLQTPVDFLPAFNPPQPESAARPLLSSREYPADKTVEMQSPSRIYVGGQLGFLYGRSSGKYGREFESGYVIGEIGNDYFHLTVGTSVRKIERKCSALGPVETVRMLHCYKVSVFHFVTLVTL